MPEKFDRCVKSVKSDKKVNAYAICTASIYKRKKSKKSRKRKIYTGPRGGKYFIRRGKKVYV